MTASLQKYATGRSGAGKFVAITAAALACFILFASPAAIVEPYPAASRLFAMAGLPVHRYHAEIEKVQARLVAAESNPALSVQGEIRNLLRANNSVPDLQLSLLDEKGGTIYTWLAQLPRRSLRPRETLNFKATLQVPPAGTASVAVAFAK